MKVLQSEILYTGRLRAVREQLENDRGKRYSHETIEHPGAVVILPLLDDGQIVFVSQYRHSIRRAILELPAGTLELNEPPERCAQREIAEEIGMAAREMIPLGILYPAPGFCTEIQHLFVARGLYPQAGIPDEDEDIELSIMALEKAEQSVVTGAISDAKSIAVLMRARLQGII
jgi:ADP-ribose pyrophosphatase